MCTPTKIMPGPTAPSEHYFYAHILTSRAKVEIAKHANPTACGKGLTIYLTIPFRLTPGGEIINYTPAELNIMRHKAMELALLYPSWPANTGAKIAENRPQDLASFDVLPLEEYQY